MQRQLIELGRKAFDRSLPFSEYDAISLLRPYIKSSLKFENLDVVSVSDALETIAKNGEGEGWDKLKVETAEPGAPAVQFWNV